MPYVNRFNTNSGSPTSEKQQLILEFNLLRAELDDIRAKYTAVVALLAAGTALGAGYNTGTTLGSKQFTPN